MRRPPLKLKKRLSQALRCALKPVLCVSRVMLLLSVWHAPIPWLHTHLLAGPIVERSEALSRHVDEFHGGAANHDPEAEGHGHHDDTETGWHMHLVLPWCPSHRVPRHADEPCDSEHSTSGLKFGIVQSLAQPLHSGNSATPQAPFSPHGASVQCPAEAACAVVSAAAFRYRALHFLGTYGCSISLGDLLSVRVC